MCGLSFGFECLNSLIRARLRSCEKWDSETLGSAGEKQQEKYVRDVIKIIFIRSTHGWLLGTTRIYVWCRENYKMSIQFRSFFVLYYRVQEFIDCEVLNETQQQQRMDGDSESFQLKSVFRYFSYFYSVLLRFVSDVETFVQSTCVVIALTSLTYVSECLITFIVVTSHV